MQAEIRDVPFRFSKSFRFAYDGITVVEHKVGDALVSIECARVATIQKVGAIIPAPKADPKAKALADEAAEKAKATVALAKAAEAAAAKALADAEADAADAAAAGGAE